MSEKQDFVGSSMDGREFKWGKQIWIDVCWMCQFVMTLKNIQNWLMSVFDQIILSKNSVDLEFHNQAIFSCYGNIQFFNLAVFYFSVRRQGCRVVSVMREKCASSEQLQLHLLKGHGTTRREKEECDVCHKKFPCLKKLVEHSTFNSCYPAPF